MREPVQEAACFYLLSFKDNISVSTSRGGCYDVFVERPWNEDDDGEEVDNGANGSHTLRTTKELAGLMAVTDLLLTDISTFLSFDISLPFRPALTNVGPSHRIIPKEAEKAIVLKARDALSGLPSPCRVLARTAIPAADSTRSVNTSFLLNGPDIADV